MGTIWQHLDEVQMSLEMPTAIGSRVAIQHADTDAFNYLCWRGFHVEKGEIGGTIVMRRDFADTAFAHYQEPAPPRFPKQILP